MSKKSAKHREFKNRVNANGKEHPNTAFADRPKPERPKPYYVSPKSKAPVKIHLPDCDILQERQAFADRAAKFEADAACYG